MQWFKHDADASQDAKLQNVLLDYGLEGYGLYWYCLELIVGKIDAENITFELEHDARIIARNTGSTVQKVEEMMRYFVSQGLFELNNSGVITCLKLARRLDKSMTSNEKMRDLIALVKVKNHDAIRMNADAVMQDKNRIDKNRVNNLVDSNEPTTDILAIQEREFGRFWRNYPNKKAKQPALSAFKRLTKGKKESQIRFYVDLILNYHLDCIERKEIGAEQLHAATLINQKRWEDNPDFYNNFKAEWIAKNANA